MKSNKGRLLITEYGGCMLSLLADKENVIQQINCESSSNESILGNIYIGRVTKVMRNLNAAFVEFMNGSSGYLSLDGGKKPMYVSSRRKDGPIRTGDRVIVQVSRDSTKSKWPVLSCEIELVGKNLIFFPRKTGISFSKKLKNAERKKQIKTRLAGIFETDCGCIVRTNAEGATLKSIVHEAETLKNNWQQIRKDAGKRRGTPCIYKAPSAYIADIRDTYTKEIKEIITDSISAYDEISKYLTEYQPEDIDRLKFYDSVETPLDLVYGISRQVGEALGTRVWLKSGGYLVIEHTEALVSIDVNSGKSSSAISPQKEYLRTNLEAAREAARQIRLRNLSGIIIIDFINLKSPEDRNLLMSELAQWLSEDHMSPDLVDMTVLGLVEITRKKGRRPLYELLDI